MVGSVLKLIDSPDCDRYRFNFHETDQSGCQRCIYREGSVCYKHNMETDLKHICKFYKRDGVAYD